MSTQGLIQIWGLDKSPSGEKPPAPSIDTWIVNTIILNRARANSLASLLNAIPSSETRLRDEGIVPFYSLLRNLANNLKSSARERGLAVPAVPDTPEAWGEEASTDPKALAAQLRPQLAEPARVALDWNFGLRDRNPRPHWSSEAAANSVSLDLFLRVAPAMAATEWGPFIAQTTNDEIKGVAAVISEEILKVRAQPGSGWGEEEAKGLVFEYLGSMREAMSSAGA